jgi:hypothetical protein
MDTNAHEWEVRVKVKEKMKSLLSYLCGLL